MRTMDKHLEMLCAGVGLIANLVAIILAVINNNAILIMLFGLLLLFIITSSFLLLSYQNKLKFLRFVEHLFYNVNNNFDVLPKICLLLDQTNEYNKLDVGSLSIKYIFDFSNIDLTHVSSDSNIEYKSIIEYTIKAKNENIPDRFVVYRGNMYSVDSRTELFQKHGAQENYLPVQPPKSNGKDMVKSAIQRYSWVIEKNYITKGNAFPISFLFHYKEKAKANDNDYIVFYPIQFAKRIGSLTFDIEFLCEKIILQKVWLYKLGEEKEFIHEPIAGVKIERNHASITIEPNCSKVDAYYLKAYWKLADEDTNNK